MVVKYRVDIHFYLLYSYGNLFLKNNFLNISICGSPTFLGALSFSPSCPLLNSAL